MYTKCKKLNPKIEDKFDKACSSSECRRKLKREYSGSFPDREAGRKNLLCESREAVMLRDPFMY